MYKTSLRLYFLFPTGRHDGIVDRPTLMSFFATCIATQKLFFLAGTNLPPSFAKPLKIQVRIGERVETRLLAVDPDGDEVTISLASPSAIGSVAAGKYLLGPLVVSLGKYCGYLFILEYDHRNET